MPREVEQHRTPFEGNGKPLQLCNAYGSTPASNLEFVYIKSTGRENQYGRITKCLPRYGLNCKAAVRFPARCAPMEHVGVELVRNAGAFTAPVELGSAQGVPGKNFCPA